MRKLIAVTAIFFASLLFGDKAFGQYYDWGQDAASVKWRTIRTPDIRYIFPEYYESQMVRMMHYLDTVRPQINYGFTHGPWPRMPLVIRGENMTSNGIVMLAPKRMELMGCPPDSPAAFPWLKQLAVHEYRHAVQYNNMNRGMIRILSWLLGQQGALIGAGFLPVWAMEGDAVLTETQMSSFGRGLQPSFSIEYRAIAAEGKKKLPTDKYFSGSFKDYMPDHYQLGYQILSWSDTHYGENVLDKTAYYSTRNPYLIFPFSLGLRKFYGSGEGKLFTDAFDDVFSFWRSAPLEDNTASIVETPTTSYTTYQYPLIIDSNTIIVLKSDLDRCGRLTRIDTRTGAEEILCYTGSVNSRMESGGGGIWWTEYRQSALWEQRVFSQLCSYDLATGKKAVYADHKHMTYPTFMPGGTIAGAEYNYDGGFTIKTERFSRALPDTISVHGLAYEQVSDKLYFIGLSDGGMWIGSVCEREEGFNVVTRPGYTAISDLRSGEGTLLFNSIGSGKDEAHMYDLARGKEYRITTSRYGSFSPHSDGNRIAVTTYTAEGYMVAMQDFNPENLKEVPYSLLPQNTVNPPRRKWDVANMDEVTVGDSTKLRSKKYRKGLHLFNFHSWAPAYFEADKIMSEGNFDVNFGVSLMSQNHLNSAISQFSYGWVDNHSLLHGKFNYYGWTPKLEIDAKWVNGSQNILGGATDVQLPERGNFLEVTAMAYVPLRLSSGSSYRTLTPGIEYQYVNSYVYSHDKGRYDVGLNKASFSVAYTENVRMAHRDFLPKFGYAAQVRYIMDPFNQDVGKMWSFFGRVYLPGILPHHSLMLRGSYQRQSAGRYAFRQKDVFPRGADFDFSPLRYMAAAADYQFPIWYPDGGINSLLYFKRVRINLTGDYARYKISPRHNQTPQWQNLWSYGANITLDFVPLRLPGNTNSTVTLSIYKPSDRDKVTIGFGMTLPI